jgi:hypothetical protein
MLEPYFPFMYKSPSADAVAGLKAFLLRKLGLSRCQEGRGTRKGERAVYESDQVGSSRG